MHSKYKQIGPYNEPSAPDIQTDLISPSVERIMDVLMIDQEPSATEQGKPPAYWPSSGNIKADRLSAQYSNSENNFTWSLL